MYKGYIKMTNKEQYVITKRIAKHGSQAIIVVPRILEDKLKPGMVVQLNIEIIEGGKDGS
ncbi:hypothetical protein HYW76_00950 [Candidatus Pacearchaeota archaeon]|nr:hypothetical protein [Candidatus Pacearchaeota archaeon]